MECSPRTKRLSRARTMLALACAACGWVAAAPFARAGVNTYADVFPGDRAAAMGGAYTALADDGSGAYYNPAGLVRIPEADISLSASAYSYQSFTFEKGFFGRDFHQEGGLFVPTGFGAIRRLGNLAFGVSIAVPEAFALRTNRSFHDVDLSGFQFDLDLDFKDDARTYEFGPTLAWSVSPELSIGATLYYLYGSRSRVSYFEIADATDPAALPTLAFSTSQERVTGVTGVLGAQWQPDRCWRFGLALRPPTDLHHYREEQDSNFTPVEGLPGLLPAPGTPDILDKGFTEGVPFSATFGTAWISGEQLTLAADVSVYGYEHFPGFETPVTRDPTWNLNLGAEYYVYPSIPLRAGFYTNNSSAPDPKTGQTNAREHVDTYGFTIGANWIAEHTELGLGLREGFETGRTPSVSVEDVAPVVPVRGTETAVFLSSRYKF